ncbi:ShlB/FhaC/HecB family hemolysin secretion/activation protein [Geothermobacter hydrogeniphilus]|nr:ShlB/FhaC/HecB family hemolysin secretion/activation protein [Geothermobacter hydrogeniphilus]
MAHGCAAPPATAGPFSVRVGGRVLLFLLLLVLLGSRPLSAATNLGTEEQRLRQRRDQRGRQQRTEVPDTRQLPETVAPPAAELPVESPCFTIDRLRLTIPADLLRRHPDTAVLLRPGGRLFFLQEELRRYRGRCLGTAGINLIIRRLTALLIDRGFTTTRIAIPEQDLSSGVLRLELIPGLIRNLLPAGDIHGFSRNALPFKPGDLLNLRDLEQGLEQMLRVAGQDVRFDLLPGDLPGESDIRITIHRSRPLRLLLSLDNSGSNDTGRWLAGATLQFDTPLRLNDSLEIGYQDSARRSSDGKSADDLRLDWSIPWGWWRLECEASRYHYRQRVNGSNQSFTSSGESERFGATLTRTLWRGQRQKGELLLGVRRRRSHSFIDDSEILVQRRNLTEAEAALQQRLYLGKAQLDLKLAHHWGSRWFGADRDLPGRQPGDPSFFYRLQTLDLNLAAPLSAASTPIRCNLTLHAQYADRQLFGSEQLAIGSRYTVRGFDGDRMLSGERGFYLRDNLDIPLGKSGQDLYFGLDYGRVGGPSSRFQPGRELVGGLVGLRGNWKGFGYDLFAGWPLHQPDGFDSGGTTVAVNLVWGM